MTHIHMRKIQNLAEERAIGFGFLGANDDVCAVIMISYPFPSSISLLLLSAK
jgi:hypothetical protein